MTIPVLGLVRVTARMQDNQGNDIENVYYWTNIGAGAVDEADFMTAVETELTTMYTAIQGSISDLVDPVDISADLVGYTGGKWVVIAHVGTIAWSSWAGGTGSSDMLPQGCSALVAASTFVPKSYARKYLGPLVETVQTAGDLTSGTITSLASFATAWLSDFVVGTNGFQASVANTTGGAKLELLTSLISGIVAYQRRRKTGRGS